MGGVKKTRRYSGLGDTIFIFFTFPQGTLSERGGGLLIQVQFTLNDYKMIRNNSIASNTNSNQD